MPSLGSIVTRATAASIARPFVTLILALAIALLSLLFIASHFEMTTDTAELISPDVDWRRHERAMDDAFPQLRDAMVVVVDGRTPELAEDGAARLAATFAADRRHFRAVRRPDGGDFLARQGLLFGSEADVREALDALVKAQPLLGPLAADPSLVGVTQAISTMIDGVDAGQASLADLQAPMRALADATDGSLSGKPTFFSWQKLLSGNGSTLAPPTRRLILIRPVLDYGSLMPGETARAAIHAAARTLQLDAAHGVRVRLTGDVPLSDEEFATLQDNIGLVAGVMLAAMLLTLWFATRSAKLVLAIILTIAIGLIVTLAAGLLAVGRLNLISITFIPLFVGLGVDFGVQICVRFNAERVGGASLAQGLDRSAVALGLPLLLAAGAVFLGFGAFLPTAYIGIAELGVIAGIGMVIALGLSVTLLPALLMILRPAAPRREVGFAAMAPFDRWLERRRRAILWAFAGSMALSIALLPWVSFDFNPLDLRDPESPAMRTLTDLTRDPDRTPNTIAVLAPNHTEAVTLARRLSALPEVKQVVSLDSFVPQDQSPKLEAIGDAALLLDVAINPFDLAPAPDDPARIAALGTTAAKLASAATAHPGPGSLEARALSRAFDRLATGRPAQRLAVETMLARPLDIMLGQIRLMLQAAPVTRDTIPADLARDWRTPDGRYRLEVFPAGNANDNKVMARFRAAVATVTPNVSGLPVATQAAAATIAGAFVQAGIIAFALVSLLLLAVLRNIREVAFTLAPVILSIFLTLGTCVVIGQPINFANIIALPLLFGVGVAFHIYFVMAWRDGATDLLQSSLARAVLFSALATGTAFGSLWLSHHPGTASMGKILMISLAWTLVCALIFEPALLGPPQRSRRDKP
ncbi:MMPL family transporter [Sphingomonas aliaeris]|uniref:MMPL family transporter n=1 Tax=Sphingomonas aliaeris TaxID=2759526 RepID=A0A974NSD2_9SPHN|nr:MMPL family transporter [Sphingomonas aliaeris]QQV76020.1 MMPL family transporter [Sphingomonas aliaeris]